MLRFWVGDRRAKEDGPEIGECCDVTRYDEVREHCADDVPGPDTAEGKSSFWLQVTV